LIDRKKVRVILNGKKACIVTVRNAIEEVRKQSNSKISIRVTYEYGDMHRFIKESIDDEITRVIVAGGDGTVNEAVDALANHPKETRVELGIIPLGTANDFSKGCNIPLDTQESFQLALLGKTIPIDIIKVDKRYFINMATVGFGAEVTKETPPWLKNIFGGASYLITGIMKMASITPYTLDVKLPSKSFSITGIVGAVCNGRQSGGGRVLAPNAYINDGLLDAIVITDIMNADIPLIIEELNNPQPDGIYVKGFKTPWIEVYSSKPAPLNLDGEPYNEKGNKVRYEVVPKAINLVLPSSCTCII